MKEHKGSTLLFTLFALAGLGFALFIVACGGGRFTGNMPAPNPTPSIQSISPTFVPAGTTSTAVTINGSGFVVSSTVAFNGAQHPVTFVNAGRLTMTLSAADLTTTGNYPIVVKNPLPGGGASPSITFSVWNKDVESSTGLQFATPVFGVISQLDVNTSTPGKAFIDFRLPDNSETLVSELALRVFVNPSGQTLQQWFEQNIDLNGMLMASGTFQQQMLLDGSAALVAVGPVPDAYLDASGPVDAAYKESNTGQIISVVRSPVNDLTSRGYTADQISELELQILGTAHF